MSPFMKSRLRRLTFATVFAAAAACFLGGCGRNQAAGRRLTIAIIPKMLNNPVFKLAEQGAQRAARNLGDVDVIYDSSQTGKPAEQAEVIRTLTAKRVDGMSISVVDANAAREAIDDAVDAGIKVMTFDSDCPNSKRATFYAVSDIEIGEELGRQLTAAVGGPKNMKGEVAILSGQSSAPNLQDRVKGVQKFLNAKDFPSIQFLPILYCDDKIDRSVEQIRTTMAAHPNLRGFVMVGGWPLFADGALDSIKDFGRTKVVSVDALEKEWDYLDKGQAYCLIAQKCFGWGEQSVKILHDLITGAKTNYPRFVNSGYDLVFKNPTPAQRADAKKRGVGCYSLAEYRKLWASWTGAQPQTADK